MARKRSVSVAALNIRTHPEHSPEKYSALIKELFNLKKSPKVRGDQHMMISQIYDNKEPLEPTFGSIARFTKIEKNLSWFNSADIEEATEEDLRKIVIPENLNPNYVPFNFALFPKEHLIFFETYSLNRSISPNSVLKLFRFLCSSEIFKNENYGDIEIDLVADANKVKEILELPNLKRLKIEIKKPNPDDLGDVEEEFEKLLEDECANSLEFELHASEGNSLSPTPKTQAMAKVAASNGSVHATAYTDDNIKLETSTLDHPMVHTEKFDPDLVPDHTAFQSVIAMFLNRYRLRLT